MRRHSIQRYYLDCVSEKWRYKIWSKKHIDGSPIILQTFQGKQYFEYVFKMIQGQYGEEIVEYQERDSNQRKVHSLVSVSLLFRSGLTTEGTSLSACAPPQASNTSEPPLDLFDGPSGQLIDLFLLPQIFGMQLLIASGD